jgi:hypothetical protein
MSGEFSSPSVKLKVIRGELKVNLLEDEKRSLYSIVVFIFIKCEIDTSLNTSFGLNTC